MKDKKRLVLLDTHAILHRAYHALPDFSSSKGEPTGALYGLITMLVKIIKELKPDYIVAAYDLPGPTHRHLVYEQYKATRPKTADDLVMQIKRSRDVIKALGIPSYEKEGYEADDIIGTVAQELKKNKDVDVIIASGDMDMLQLVDDERVRVYTFKKGLSETILYDEKGVVERWGFPPERIADYKGLRGDPSDNIPGVKGVGEKTATALITEFGSIENIYKELEKDPEKLQKAGVKEGILQKLKEQKEEAYMSKALAQIPRDVPINFELPHKNWKEGADPQKALDLVSELEFRSLAPRIKELFGTGQLFAEEAPDAAEALAQIPQEEFEKLALAVWVLDSNITKPTADDIYRAGKSRDWQEAKKYLLNELAEKGLGFVFDDIEVPLMPVLRRMEKRGILIDKKFLTELSKEYTDEQSIIAKRIYKEAGKEFNINSPRQLSEILFDTLGLSLKNHKKTAGGARTTRESELEKMRELHPIIGEILSYRELQKLLSTYIDTIPKLLDAENRLHTTLLQAGTTTGRVASQEPNLQNIPIKSDLGRRIRNAFVATEGFSFVSFDYSQIELRIAALLSGDEALAEIFREGRDVHAEVAARVFNVVPDKVTYEMRRRAKVINFGILYGMGVNSLREGLGTSRAEAADFHEKYFESFPQLAKYLEETKADAARTGFTQTLFGRRRYFEGIRSSIPYVRASAERMAINAPMQGTQADIVKLAMVEIDKLIETEGLREKAYMLLQVHDELVFEIEENLVEEFAPRIKYIMENVVPEKDRHSIPFIAKGMRGLNWGEMSELESR